MPGLIGDSHRRIAPFLVTGLAGAELTPTEREMLSRAPPAGVILFHRNVESIEQLCRLTHDIRAIVEEASGLSPLIMADHEGGRISVLARAIGAPPSPMAAWKPGSEELLTGIVAETSRLMRSCGINLSLSPVADVNSEPLNPVIGTRSFGEDPESVSAAVRIALRAISGEGILSCLKHFPGHGATTFDSHLTLPVIGKTIDQLQDVELPPFVAGIEEGADTVMTAHIALIEGDPPASLDRRIVTDLLREELGFDGVIITDALEMAGVLPDGIAMKSIDSAAADKSGDAVPAAIMAMALEAGNDLLLMSRELEEVYEELNAHAAVLEEALSDTGLSRQLQKSSARITSIRENAAAIVMDESAERVTNASLHETIIVQGGPLEPALPVFLGARPDFDNYVVRRFIFRLLKGLGGGGQSDDPGQIHTDELSPVRTDEGRKTGLYLFEPLRKPASVRSLVMLCRKPPPGDVVRAAVSGCDSVVAAGRPWDAGLLWPEISVAVTYGIFDAAADDVAEMLRERV